MDTLRRMEITLDFAGRKRYLAKRKKTSLKMTYQEIFNLFGYSEFSPEIKELLTKLHIPSDRPEESVCWRRFQSSNWDLSLTFIAKNNYKNDYGPVVKEYIVDYDENFFEEISFGGTGKGVKYPHALPHDLHWGDSMELVQQKIPVKKSRSGTGSYGPYLVFHLEDYWILTAFNDNQKLIWLRVQLHEKAFKRKRELTKSLRQQNKNLTTLHINDLILLKHESPVSEWIKRMKEGDNNFTIKNIDESKELLITFIDNLLIAIEQKKASAIYSTTKKVIKGFNQLNNKYQSFIETLEREELIDYIHKSIQMTGFKIEGEIDLTEEWREW